VKNIFKKENLMPVIVLSAICLVVAALMGVVNMVTGPIIEKAESQKVYDSLRAVLDGEFETLELPGDAPSTVTGLYKVTDGGELIGHVVTVAKQGYASVISLTVGIDTEGKTTKVVITGQQETHGKDISPLIDGLSAGITSDEVSDVEHIANATKTSNYIKAAVADAFKVVGFSAPSTDDSSDDSSDDSEDDSEATELPKTDEELEALVKSFIGEGVEITNVTPEENNNFVKRVYCLSGNKGYVAYVYSINERYGVVDTENLVHIGTDGAIKNIMKLTWSVSDPMPEYGYNPPSADRLDQLYNDFTGKNTDNIGDVDLVTGATNTTTVLKNSLVEALKKVNYYIENSSDTAKEAALLAKMEKLVPNAKCFEKIAIPENAAESLKALYKVIGFDGYVAYVITSTEYVDVETEALVYINAKGAVGNIELITWTVGHGVEPGDFAASLVGKNAKQLADVELVTSATVTAGNLRDAVVDAINSVPKNNTPIIVGVAVAALAVISAITVIIIKRRRRA